MVDGVKITDAMVGLVVGMWATHVPVAHALYKHLVDYNPWTIATVIVAVFHTS